MAKKHSNIRSYAGGSVVHKVCNSLEHSLCWEMILVSVQSKLQCQTIEFLQESTGAFHKPIKKDECKKQHKPIKLLAYSQSLSMSHLFQKYMANWS